VIDDVDATLEALIRTVIPPSACLVDFRAPSREWSDSLSRPCVNLFLHELIEEREARGADWTDIRDERGRVTVRQPPLRTFRLSYLVSAWQPASAKDASGRRAHALLGRVLQVFVEADPIPAAVLQGAMANESGLVELSVAEPIEQRVRPHELWAGLGVPTRSCFDLLVKAPLRTSVAVEAAAAAESITLSTARQDAFRHPAGRARAFSGGSGQNGRQAPEKRWTSFRVREGEAGSR
jgi:hypothetical protein